MPARILHCGDTALTLQLGDSIAPEINAQVIALAAQVEAMKLPGLVDIVPTYRSVLLRYDPEVIRGAELEHLLEGLSSEAGPGETAGRLWVVPCLYGGAVGQDLEELAQMKGMSVEDLVALHSGAEYRIYMIGFAPGFAYLGGLPEVLHTPRLPRPRQNIPAGAIGIGGQQGNINSVAGPSGWRFLGWTPLRSFDPSRPEPFLFRAGDRIRFCPVDAEEAAALAARAAAGESIISPESAA